MAERAARSIQGTFTSQEHDGRLLKDLECAPFDATTLVLSLPLRAIWEFTDEHAGEQLGRSAFSWPEPKPCRVHLAHAICQFFDVASTQAVSAAALAKARLEHGLGPVRKTVLQVEILHSADVCVEGLGLQELQMRCLDAAAITGRTRAVATSLVPGGQVADQLNALQAEGRSFFYLDGSELAALGADVTSRVSDDRPPPEWVIPVDSELGALLPS